MAKSKKRYLSAWSLQSQGCILKRKKCCDRSQRIRVRNKKRHGISGAFLMGKVPCSENVKMQTASEEKKNRKAFSLNRKYEI